MSVLALAFFAVPTRVHERYLFPLFALAAIPLAFSWRWRIVYVVASVATFLNMYVVLTTIYPDNPSIRDWLGIGEAIRSQFGRDADRAGQHRGVPVGLRPAPARRPGGRSRRSSSTGASPTPGTRRPAAAPVGTGCAGRRRRSAGAAAAAGAGATAAALAGSAPQAAPRAGLVRPPVMVGRRPDRLVPGADRRDAASAPTARRRLSREGRGRLDRLDLWLLIVLVVAAMGLRMFRLAEPARMHFDEVYHARTAAEFLQDWRYGISHYIYEWTHPHLAKYAMAGGIVLFAGPRHAGDQRPRRAGPRRGHRAPPAGPVIRRPPATATASGSRPARR